MFKKCLMLLCVFVGLNLNAQDFKNQLRVGLVSDVGLTSLSALTLNPQLSYYPTNNVGITAGISWLDLSGESTESGNVGVRYYFANCFGELGLSTDFDNTSFSAAAGYTGFLTKRFYIEPALRYHSGKDTKKLGIEVGCGLLIN